MFKGHAKIELTNVDTGEKQTYEHDNLITNALAQNLSKMAQVSDFSAVNQKFLPLHEKGMGGILLFENELETSADNMAIPSPSENSIIGYASTDSYSGNDTKRGGRNLNESEEVEKGYKFVWDFSTSQANGTISALALTSAKCGALPYSYSSNSSFAQSSIIGILSSAVDFDFDTNIATCAILTSSLELTISKIRIPINEIRVNTNLLIPEVVSTEIINLPVSLNTNSHITDSGDYYYVIYASNSKNVSISRIDKSNFTLDTSFGDGGVFLIEIENAVYVNQTYRSALIKNNYIYILYGQFIHKINMEDLTDYERISVPYVSTTSYRASTIFNDSIYNSRYIYHERKYDYVLIERSNSNAGLITNSYDIALFMDKSGLALSIGNTFFNIGTTFDYLATVNNLDTPVIKTSAQTMKITYTLTEA